MKRGSTAHGVTEENLESVGEAFVSIARDGTVRVWNRAAERIFGFTRDEALGEVIADLIVPERYRRAHLLGLARYLETGEAQMVNRRLELEALHSDGHKFPVELIIMPMRLEEGEVVFNAFLHDITARRRADRELRRLAAVVESSQDAIVSGTPDGTIETWNAGAERLYGYSAEEMVGRRSVTRLLSEGDFSGATELRERLLAGEPVRDLETRERRKDGSFVDVSVSVSPLVDADGRVVGLSSIARDLTARKEAEAGLRRYSEHLGELALRDRLTGLPNARAFDAGLDRVLQRSRGHRELFAVALFNLRGFKQVNQTRGRLEGDRLLRAVAAALRGVCRRVDTAARVRGDEFALLLPGTDEDAARRTAERVAAEVAGIDPALSLSFGVVSWPAAGEDKDLLLAEAEAALHASKPESASGGGQAPPAEVTERIERVLALARHQLGMDLTFVGEFRGGNEVFRVLDGDAASFGLEQGSHVALPESYCQRMVDGRIDCAVPDAAADAELAALAATREAGIGSYLGVPLALPDGRLYGALCGLSHAPRELSARQVELMRFLAELVAELLDQEEREVRRRRVELETSGVYALVAALEARDHYTGEHSHTVVRLATAVAQRLALAEDQVLEAEQVAILHDVGKVGIPDQVLQKPGPLTDDEWELMRQHPAVGERIVASTESLAHLAPAIRAEHERYDGAGYPDGLRGEEIPLASRITLACDAYHAMTSDRPYRAALSVTQARTELQANARTQFDPQVVEALLGALEGPPSG